MNNEDKCFIKIIAIQFLIANIMILQKKKKKNINRSVNEGIKQINIDSLTNK